LNYLDANDLSNTTKAPAVPKLKIYPVPARGLIRIDGMETQAYDEIRVLDIQGQLQKIDDQKKEQQLEVDISKLGKGTYFLQLFKQNQLVAKGRFIVQ